MRDLIRDWQKWTPKERAASILILIALLIAAPALTATYRHGTAPEGRAGAEIPS